MARQKLLAQAIRLAMFALLVIKTPAFAGAGSISLGIEAATARHTLNIASNHDAELGIWVFPDANGMVYTYRFDSKFGGKISGIQIGEAISDVIATLGRPTRTFGAGSYLFDGPGNEMRVDVDSKDRVEIVFLLKGSFQISDTNTVRVGIPALLPAVQPVAAGQPLAANPRAQPGVKPPAAEVSPMSAQPVMSPAIASGPRCMSLAEITPNMMPQTLYASVRQCILVGRMQDASDVFRLAGLFWRFDAERVSDETAHGAGQVIIMNMVNSLPPDPRQQFAKFTQKMERDEANLRDIVKDARRLGPPKYYPSYMILHGVGLPGNAAEQLKPNFNAQQIWQDLVGKLSASIEILKAKDNDGSLFKLKESYWVSSVAYSPNGKYLVTASWVPKLQNIHVWNLKDR